MESTSTWSAPTVMVPRSPGLGAGRPVCFQPGCGVAETTRVVATQALPARRGFESCSTRSMIGSQHPSPTCSSSRPVFDTVTNRVCPTHSPAKAANEGADVVGVGVLVLVAVLVVAGFAVAVWVDAAGRFVAVTVTVVVPAGVEAAVELLVGALLHAVRVAASSAMNGITREARGGMPGSLGRTTSLPQ